MRQHVPTADTGETAVPTDQAARQRLTDRRNRMVDDLSPIVSEELTRELEGLALQPEQGTPPGRSCASCRPSWRACAPNRPTSYPPASPPTAC